MARGRAEVGVTRLLQVPLWVGIALAPLAFLIGGIVRCEVFGC